MTRPRGFTLVEVAVALALTGLVALLLLHGMRDATLGLDRLARHVDAYDRRHGAAALLRRQLTTAIALAAAPGAAPDFAGLPQSLQFVTSSGGAPGLYRIALDYRDRALVMTRRVADPAALPRLERSVLAQGLSDLRFAYFGALPGGDFAWHERWDTVRYLPRLVRITIGDGTTRPPLIVRLWGADG